MKIFTSYVVTEREAKVAPLPKYYLRFSAILFLCVDAFFARRLGKEEDDLMVTLRSVCGAYPQIRVSRRANPDHRRRIDQESTSDAIQPAWPGRELS